MKIEDVSGIGKENAKKLNKLKIFTTNDIKDITQIINIKYLGVTQIFNLCEAANIKISEEEIKNIRTEMLLKEILNEPPKKNFYRKEALKNQQKKQQLKIKIKPPIKCEDIDIILYNQEKEFMENVTEIFINNFMVNVRNLYNVMLVSKYTVRNKLYCACDITTWIDTEDKLNITNQNNYFKISVIPDFVETISYKRSGINSPYNVFDNILDIMKSHNTGDSHISGISFNSYIYMQDFISSVNVIINELDEMNEFNL